uniref:Glutathione S-transferase n=1 Tax=Phaedon brassicae TaxID=154011 RepID=A0A9Y1PN01_9CUCU|nr:glutathione S-transferase [Phaedon brassicae]WET52790.1 glutathione S-transferase [Phaedon brassicae]
MAPTLYMIITSPPVRSVLMCAKAIGVDLKSVNVDLFVGDHHKPEFLKMNPQHTVPVLDDDGFILTDSHAIMSYLVSKYGKDKSLYPTDLQQRALVDHRLHFDSSILFARGLIVSWSVLFEGAKEIPQKLLDQLFEAIHMVEKFLQKTKYVAGDHVTIADFSFVTSITSWAPYLPVPLKEFPKITAWLKKMKELPYYSENQIGLDQFLQMVKTRIQNEPGLNKKCINVTT